MTFNMLFIIKGDKLCKHLWILMAKSEYFYDELKMIYLFLEAHKTMICSRNKQFLMPTHEDGWSYCSMFFNETSKLKLPQSFRYHMALKWHIINKSAEYINLFSYFVTYWRNMHVKSKVRINPNFKQFFSWTWFYQGSKLNFFRSFGT